MDLRYSAMARTRDITLSFGAAVVLGSMVFPFFKHRFDQPGFALLLAVWVGLSAPMVLVAGLWRWGRRGRLDKEGASLTLSARGPFLRLAWADVEEIYRAGATGFELRGDGARLLFSDDFDGMDAAWARLWQLRGDSLRRELHAALDAGTTIRFRGPVDPSIGLLKAGLLLAFLGPPLLAPLAFAARHPEYLAIGAALFCSVWVGVILWGMLRVTAWRSGWVEIGAEGLAMRGAGRARRWAWSELASVAGWVVRPKSGRARRVDPGLGNIVYLESLCRRRITPPPEPRASGAPSGA
jgi:hypothetical protein